MLVPKPLQERAPELSSGLCLLRWGQTLKALDFVDYLLWTYPANFVEQIEVNDQERCVPVRNQRVELIKRRKPLDLLRTQVFSLIAVVNSNSDFHDVISLE